MSRAQAVAKTKSASTKNAKLAAPNFKLLEHPVITHKISLLRNKSCSISQFRRIVFEIGAFVGYELSRDFPLVLAPVQTPETGAEYIERPFLSDDETVIIPILQTGLVIADGILSVLPMLRQGQIGILRDPNPPFSASPYLLALPDIAYRNVIVTDAAVSTGGTASCALSLLKSHGVSGPNIKLFAMLFAQEGIDRLQKEHPDVAIYGLSLEEGLTDKGHVYPGFGNAANRLYGIAP